jgi:hypothetical protein
MQSPGSNRSGELATDGRRILHLDLAHVLVKAEAAEPSTDQKRLASKGITQHPAKIECIQGSAGGAIAILRLARRHVRRFGYKVRHGMEYGCSVRFGSRLWHCG